MKFSQLKVLTVKVVKFSFSSGSDAIQQVYGKSHEISFIHKNNEITVKFLGETWEAIEIEEHDRITLYLIAQIDHMIWRIRLFCKIGAAININQYLSGEGRYQHADQQVGDWCAKAMLLGEDLVIAADKGRFKAPETSRSYFPFQEKHLKTLMWTKSQVFEWAVGYCKVDEEQAKLLENEGIDGDVLLHIRSLMTTKVYQH
jgi:hypothetical protein